VKIDQLQILLPVSWPPKKEVSILIIEWKQALALVVCQEAVLMKWTCECLKTNVPGEVLPQLLIRIKMKRSLPKFTECTKWIKREIYEYHLWKLLAVPNRFSGKKEDFKWFRRQFGLYITVNKKYFNTDQAMVLFILSYMMEGQAELWANTYVDEALSMGE
jgi:hypothetical protein